MHRLHPSTAPCTPRLRCSPSPGEASLPPSQNPHTSQEGCRGVMSPSPAQPHLIPAVLAQAVQKLAGVCQPQGHNFKVIAVLLQGGEVSTVGGSARLQQRQHQAPPTPRFLQAPLAPGDAQVGLPSSATQSPGDQAAAPVPPPPRWPAELLLLSPNPPPVARPSTFITLLMALMAASSRERARGSSRQWSAWRRQRKRRKAGSSGSAPELLCGR